MFKKYSKKAVEVCIYFNLLNICHKHRKHFQNMEADFKGKKYLVTGVGAGNLLGLFFKVKNANI